MTKGGKFKHEWHLYSITVIGLVGFFFFLTIFKDISLAGVAMAAFAFIASPFMASENWKNISPDTHKEVSLYFIIGGLIWALYLVFKNKISPRWVFGKR